MRSTNLRRVGIASQRLIGDGTMGVGVSVGVRGGTHRGWVGSHVIR